MKKRFLLVLLLTLMTFTGTWAVNQGYAVFDETTGVLTFKYGEKPSGNGVYDTDNTVSSILGWTYLSDWINNSWGFRNKIVKVVFDSSYAEARPKSTAGWFSDCTGLTEIVGLDYLNTSEVTDMSYMFEDCSSLTSININSFDTQNVTTMQDMFAGCSSVTTIELKTIDTSNVTNMLGLFMGCTSLKSIDLSAFQTSNVTNMSLMFAYCIQLESLDLNSFDTRQVTNMSNMFYECRGIKTIDMDDFNTSNVTNMSKIFSFCLNLRQINLLSFNTSNVTNMSEMFNRCSFEEIDLSSFDTSNVADFSYMFSGCENLISLDISNFNTKKAKEAKSMFASCTNLKEVIFGVDFSFEGVADFDYSTNSNNSPFYLSQAINYIKLETDVNSLKEGMFHNGYYKAQELPILDVPEEYKSNYESKFDNNFFYNGWFILKTHSNTEIENPENPQQEEEPSIPHFNTKRLLSITQEEEGYNRTGTFNYDEYGRVTSFTHTRDEKQTVYNYSYTDGEIIITCEHSKGTDSYSYKIKNGRVTTGERFFAGDNIAYSSTYEYDENQQLTQINESTTQGGKSNSHQYIFNWLEGNLTSMKYYKNGDLRISTEYEYNQLASEPMVHAIFGFGEGEEIYIDEIVEFFAIYPYMGKLPLNLFSHNTVEDILEGNRQYTYNYSYETDLDGNIVKISIGSNNYVLQWDSPSITPPANKSFTINGLTYTLLEDGESVSVKVADTNISGDIAIPTIVKDYNEVFFVTEIEESAFANCTQISSLIIPDGITKIGDNAFNGCQGLTQLFVNIEEPLVISSSAFEGVDKAQCVINVPEGCADKYRDAPVWEEFWLVVADGDIVIDRITYKQKTDGTMILIAANRTAEGRYDIPSSVIIDSLEYVVTEIGTNAFKDCKDMTAVTIPASITEIGGHAFAGCVNLTEIYTKGKKPAGMKGAFVRQREAIQRAVSQFEGIDFDKCILYVPFGSEGLYREAEGWSLFKNILGVHGEDDPAVVVTAKNYTREYGEENPAFEFTVEGATLDGQPVIECTATAASDAGEYDIVVKKGSVKNFNDTYVSGMLTITKAPLKVSVKAVEREQGTENPQFEVTYEGWKLTDTESVLTKKPVVTTTATKESPVGEYAIIVGGGEARNYELNYMDGKLTVVISANISDLIDDGKSVDVYTMAGVLVKRQATTLKGLKKGVYIVHPTKEGVQGKNGQVFVIK